MRRGSLDRQRRRSIAVVASPLLILSLPPCLNDALNSCMFFAEGTLMSDPKSFSIPLTYPLPSPTYTTTQR